MSKHTSSTHRLSPLPSDRLGKILLTASLVLIAIVLVAASLGTAPQDLGASPAEPDGRSETAAVSEVQPSAASPYATFLDTHLEDILLTMHADGDERARLGDELHAVYAQRDYRPAWLTSSPILRRARAFTSQLAKQRIHGLDPALYTTYVAEGTTRRLMADIKAVEIARYPEAVDQLTLETRLTLTLLQFTRDLHGGQLEEVDLEEWHKEPAPVNVVGRVVSALESEDRKELKRHLAPTHEGFKRLAQHVEIYRQLVDAGGWPTLPESDTLEVGDTVDAELHQALVDRLLAEGDLSEHAPLTTATFDKTATSDRAAAGSTDNGLAYDARLAAAVERFQARHGLTVDGKLGPKTQRAMNVPAAERLRQIEANLERWRWLPEQLPADRIEVNVPAFELRGYRANELAVTMAVAVGKPSWATPIFEDEVLYAEVNPYWNIPESIAADEILPAIRKDPSYLEKEGMEVLAGWNADDSTLADVDWNDPGSYGADYRIRQRPGAGNALGQIKFIFPNPHGVYLHDTPAQRAFQRANRAVSHGCVRVAEPLKLADFLFPDPALENVEAALGEGDRERINLDEPMPVALHYWTAFVDEDGILNFRRDLYGIDEDLAEMLDEAAPEVATSTSLGGLTIAP